MAADYTDENSGSVREHLEAPRKHLGACGFSLGQDLIKHHRNTIPRTFVVQSSTKFDLVGCSGESLGPPCDALGSRPQKTTKESLSGVPFLGTFLTYVLTFLMCVFCLFFKLLSYEILAPKAPAGFNFEGRWVPFGAHSQHI